MTASTPGRYAKFITVLLGQVLLYFQTFGWEWNIKPAATMAAVALAVLAVPNTPKPVPPVVTQPSLTVTPPAV